MFPPLRDGALFESLALGIPKCPASITRCMGSEHGGRNGEKDWIRNSLGGNRFYRLGEPTFRRPDVPNVEFFPVDSPELPDQSKEPCDRRGS
jgi:hypothetical protein